MKLVGSNEKTKKFFNDTFNICPLRAAEFGLNLAPYNAMFFIGINDVCNMTMFMIFTVCVIGYIRIIMSTLLGQLNIFIIHAPHIFI